MISEKARLFHHKITKQEDGFTASRGWLDNFKHRHCIRLLNEEKLSCDETSIEPFRKELQQVLNECAININVVGKAQSEFRLDIEALL